MKKILCVLLCVTAVFAFCSCTFQEERIDGAVENETKQEESNEEKPVKDTAEEEKSLSKKEVKALADAAIEKMSVVPEYPEGYPTLDDVVAQYERATQAIGWIVGTERVATDGNYTIDANGMTYSKVLPDCYLGAKNAGKNKDADMLIYNKKALEAYLATLICADEAHEYVVDIDYSFDVPKFVEGSNGELYALPYAFPAAGYGEKDTYKLSENSDGSYTLSVTYDILDENDEVEKQAVYNVKYIKENGRWVFENFRVVKQH